MSDWSNNNRAHTQTWFALRVLEQKKKTFKTSKKVKMNGLAVWNPTASQQARALAARTLAIQMDNMFRMTFDAKYESGVTKAKAVSAMATILKTADKTMLDLAVTNDKNYAFLGEPGNV